METMNNYNDVILVVDLDARECETVDLGEELIEKALGGAAVNMELYERYKDRDPLILGTGFFTATFMPGACGGVMTGRSPVTGKIAHVPFGWQAGVELKLTGFDFVVILGTAAAPVRLWLHDGLSDIDDSSDVWGADTWTSVDKIREAYGDEMIQLLLIGKAGENRVPLAQVCENYWGGKDRAGLGAVFGAKNLKAVAMRGLGALEVAEGFFPSCMELKKEVTGGTINGKAGLKDIAVDLGIDGAVIEKLQSITHRSNASYNCPYPYYTFVKYREAPTATAMKGEPEPGCLISDIGGFAALQAAGLDPAEAMERCCRLGLEPSAAAAAAADIAALDGLAENGTLDAPAPWPIAGNPGAAILESAPAFYASVPPRGIFADKDAGADWWVKRQALAAVIGLDPVLALMAPEITAEKVAELVQASAEWDDFSAADLQRIVSELIEKSNA